MKSQPDKYLQDENLYLEKMLEHEQEYIKELHKKNDILLEKLYYQRRLFIMGIMLLVGLLFGTWLSKHAEVAAFVDQMAPTLEEWFVVWFPVLAFPIVFFFWLCAKDVVDWIKIKKEMRGSK